MIGKLTSRQRKRFYWAVGVPSAIVGTFCTGLFWSHAITGRWDKATGWGFLALVMVVVALLVVGMAVSACRDIAAWVMRADEDDENAESLSQSY